MKIFVNEGASMYLTFTKKNILIWGSLLCIFLSYKCMNLRFFSNYGNELRYLSWILTAALATYLYRDVVRIGKQFVFVKWFFVYILIAQIILCIYSMITYNENILDMFICAGEYLLFLIVFILLIGMEEFGAEKFLHIFYIFTIVYMALCFVHAILFNFMGIRLLGIGHFSSRSIWMRASLGPLYVVLMVVLFWKILSKERKLIDVAVFVIGVFMELYIEQTRINQMALIIAFFFMWFFKRDKTSKKMVQVGISIIFLLLFFKLGLQQEVIDTFSSDPTVNSNANSTIARLNAIEYFDQFFRSNPLIGMGWVRPKNDELMLVYSGPNGTAFFDDLGFLGQVYRQGLLGAFIYIIMLIRMLYVSFKLPANSKKKNLVLGIMVYLIVSAISLNAFDGQRIIGTAFFFAIVEKNYNFENKGGECALN